MQHPLIERMLSRIKYVSIPNNPRNKKAVKEKLNYFFVSTRVVEYKDGEVVKQKIVGKTYRKQ